MGIFKHLLFWPVTGPSFLTRFSLEKVEGAVRSELTDDAAVKHDLLELQMLLELGDIDEEEYVQREAELMLRLRDVRHWREQFGMATPGGLVRVADDAGGEPAPTDPGASSPEPAPEEVRDASEGPQVAGSGPADVEISFGFDEDD